MVKLQCGHRLSAMEIFKKMNASLRVDALQWGHRLSAMEIRRDARAA